MREKIIGTKTDFRCLIDYRTSIIKNDLKRIEDLLNDERQGIQRYPKANMDIVKSIKNSLFSNILSKVIALYSDGEEIINLIPIYKDAIHYMNESWGKKTAQDFTYRGSKPFFSYEEYWRLITMLSLGKLLNISKEEFEIIVKIRNIVPETDTLLDFIITENYNPSYTMVMETNVYSGLVPIIKQSFIDKQEAIKELKIFLDKIWYKMNREMYWYNSHKDSDIYLGYWSFESAALVKLLGLDDSILRDNKYYPYDIAHFNN